MWYRLKKFIWNVTGAQEVFDAKQQKIEALDKELSELHERVCNPCARKTSNQCGACKYGWLDATAFGIVTYSCLKEPVCPDFEWKYKPKDDKR